MGIGISELVDEVFVFFNVLLQIVMVESLGKFLLVLLKYFKGPQRTEQPLHLMVDCCIIVG